MGHKWVQKGIFAHNHQCFHFKRNTLSYGGLSVGAFLDFSRWGASSRVGGYLPDFTVVNYEVLWTELGDIFSPTGENGRSQKGPGS